MRRAAMIACAGLLCGHAWAQDDAAAPAAPQGPAPVGTAVAAVVNDHPISTFDVQQRVRLMVATSGAQLDENALQQMQSRALRDLVEERLKLQEAERFELTIDEGEIDQEIARIAANGGTDPAQLERDLAAQGIAIDTLRDQFRADIAWERLVNGRYGNRVSITESEIEDELADLRGATEEPQFLLSEICLPLDSPDQAEQMRGVGMQMIQQMQQGVPFVALAQQFSACPSAARGGDLGWVRMQEMSPEVQQLIPQLAEGNVSLPLPTDGMVKMIALRQKRDAAEVGEFAYQVVYAGAPKSVDRATFESAIARLPQTNGCRSESLSEDLGQGIGVTPLPLLAASAFDPRFEPVLRDLERNQVSEVMESENDYHAVLMCQRDEGLGLPTRDQIRAQMRGQELERLGRRYLRDVERDGAIDVRLGQG